MKNIILKLLAVVMLLSFALPAQESEKFIKDLRKCSAQWRKNQQADLDIAYKAYPSYTSAQASEETNGKYCKNGDQVYYSLMGTTFIQDKHMLLVIDDSLQRVVVRKPGGMFDPVQQQLDAGYLKTYTRSITAQDRGQERVYYKLEMKDAEVKTLGLCINRQKNTVEKVELFYANETEIISPKGVKSKVLPRMEITYQPSAHQSDAGLFSTGRVVFKNKKGFVLAPAYKKYQLIDQYHNKTK